MLYMEDVMNYSELEYRNVFKEFGYDENEINKRLEDIFNTMFYGEEGEKIYYEVSDDMGFVTDTGNNDVRTEGMSYAMMMCVQLNKKKEFDKLWKWTKTYMYMGEGYNAGYFAWSCALDGTKNSMGPAPDGEEFFAMALILASHRFGDGEGIFNYSKEALAILRAMLHNPQPMFDKGTHYIKFITSCDYSDPSYHLPHFYEMYADELKKQSEYYPDIKDELLEDAAFYEKAATASREYFTKACDHNTGMSAEYAQYDGTPYMGDDLRWGRHDYFYSDAYRTAANMGLDYAWCQSKRAKTCEYEKAATRALRLFYEDKCQIVDGEPYYDVYTIDGKKVEKVDDSETALSGKVLHPYGLIATNAQSYLATDKEDAANGSGAYAVRKFWETPLRKGARRYYDNCLYIFAFMALSGNYRMY